MGTAVIDFPGLRRGVAAVRVPRGVVFHDAFRWKLYLVSGDANPEKVFAWLRDNGLVEGAPVPRAVGRLSQTFYVPRDQAPEGGFTLLEEARFACSACGRSCRSLNLGPLFPADVARLRALDWSGTSHDPDHFFALRNGEPQDGTEAEPLEGRTDLFLRKVGDGCQFLQADNLCEVHARFGADAKPHMCRAFPIQLRAAPTGVVVGLRLDECLEAEKALQGPKLDEDAGALRHLWSEPDKVHVLPPLVWLTDDVLLPWNEYEEVERRLLLGPAEVPFPGQAHGGGIAFLLRAVSALAAKAGASLPPPAPIEELQSLRRWALDQASAAPAEVRSTPRLPIARATAAGLDEAGGKLEERIARILLFNKDALQHMDVLRGVSQLVLKVWMLRERALAWAGEEGAARANGRHVNRAAKESAHDHLRDEISVRRLDPVALAAAVAALSQ